MRWLTQWWGIVFLADTDEDVALIRQIEAALPDRAEVYYDESGKCFGEGPYGRQDGWRSEWPCKAWLKLIR